MHVYDLIRDLKITIKQEVERIEKMLNKNIASYKYLNLRQNIEDVFIKLHTGNKFTSFDEMLEELKMTSEDYYWNVVKFSMYYELILTILREAMVKELLDNASHDNVIKIKQIIDLILEKLNFTCYINDENQYVYIVEKNKATSEAIECVEDKQVALELLEYNRVTLKGNLDAKRKILNALANYVEPILKKKEITSSHYSSLADNLGYALNSFHIRHNNMEGKNKNDKLVAMTNDKLEKWYDDTYTMMVMLIIAEKELVISKNVKEFKQP